MIYFKILSQNKGYLPHKNGVYFLSNLCMQGNTNPAIQNYRRNLMKKITILALCLALAASLCACGCTNETPATTPSVNTTPNQTDKMPTDTMTIPVPETNIPDASVDDSMPGGITDGTNGGANGDTNGGTGRSGFPMGGVQ